MIPAGTMLENLSYVGQNLSSWNEINACSKNIVQNAANYFASGICKLLSTM